MINYTNFNACDWCSFGAEIWQCQFYHTQASLPSHLERSMHSLLCYNLADEVQPSFFLCHTDCDGKNTLWHPWPMKKYIEGTPLTQHTTSRKHCYSLTNFYYNHNGEKKNAVTFK